MCETRSGLSHGAFDQVERGDRQREIESARGLDRMRQETTIRNDRDKLVNLLGKVEISTNTHQFRVGTKRT